MGLRNKKLFIDERCFFVTTTCLHWYSLIEESDSYELITSNLSFYCKKYFAEILGYVIMPNHIHFIIYFTKSNYLSDYMRDFKKFTSVKIRQALENKNLNIQRLRLNEKDRVFQVWKDKFDDVYINSRDLLETKLEYIHNNPLNGKWNLANTPEDYKHSSACFYYHGNCPPLETVHYKKYF